MSGGSGDEGPNRWAWGIVFLSRKQHQLKAGSLEEGEPYSGAGKNTVGLVIPQKLLGLCPVVLGLCDHVADLCFVGQALGLEPCHSRTLRSTRGITGPWQVDQDGLHLLLHSQVNAAIRWQNRNVRSICVLLFDHELAWQGRQLDVVGAWMAGERNLKLAKISALLACSDFRLFTQ